MPTLATVSSLRRFSKVSNFGFTDILTSGADPSDGVGFGATGVGMAGETVNTFIDPSNPMLDSTFVLPFTDPLAQIFTDFIQFGF